MEERFELFTALITKISRSIRKIKNQEVEEYGLRSPHVSCLYYLYITDGLTATELCERCEEDKATVSRSLDYLETNGYILCESKSAKRYKSPLYLTEQGRMVAAKVAAKISRVLDDVSAAMTEEERVAFYRSLAMISDSLEACIKSDREQ
ncbi:MAG: MarR family transcriptional regulator [Clostridia bacterium]|nr:MarR family transcriptional regulator [Clostridia bacterium]